MPSPSKTRERKMTPPSPSEPSVTSGSMLESDTITIINDKTESPTKSARPRACTICRRLKMKCAGGTDATPCERCARSGKECIFEEHKRGRKIGVKVTEEEAEEFIMEAQASPRKTASVTSSPVSTRARTSQSPKLYKMPKIPVIPKSPKPLNTPKPPRIPKTPRIPKSKSPKVLKSVRTPKLGRTPKVERTPKTELVEKLIKLPTRIKRKYVRRKGIEKPVENDSIVSEETFVQTEVLLLPKKIVQDPIEADILDEHTATILYNEFMLHMNIHVQMIDPSLHNMHSIKKRSPFLFTVILASAAKFVKPLLEAELQNHAENQLGEVFLSGEEKTTEIVQAITIMRFWRDLVDIKAVFLVGSAIRLGVEMRWDILGDEIWESMSELGTREQRTKQRTWMVLNVLDKILSSPNGGPLMVQPESCIQAKNGWNTGEYGWVPGDTLALALLDLHTIGKDLRRDYADDGISEKMFDLLIQDANKEFDDWDEHWEEQLQKVGKDMSDTPFFIACVYKHHHVVVMNALAIQRSLSSTKSRKDANAIAMCYTSSIDLLKLTLEYSKKSKGLRYITDHLHSLIAYCEINIIKILLLCGQKNHRIFQQTISQNLVLQLLLHLSVAFGSAFVGEGSESLSIVHSKFTKNLVEYYRQLQIQANRQVASSNYLANTWTSGEVYDEGEIEFDIDRQILDVVFEKAGAHSEMEAFV